MVERLYGAVFQTSNGSVILQGQQDAEGGLSMVGVFSGEARTGEGGLEVIKRIAEELGLDPSLTTRTRLIGTVGVKEAGVEMHIFPIADGQVLVLPDGTSAVTVERSSSFDDFPLDRLARSALWSMGYGGVIEVRDAADASRE